MKSANRSLFPVALASFLAGCAVMYLVLPRETASAKTTAPNQPHPRAAQIQNAQAPSAAKSQNATGAQPQPQIVPRGAEARRVLNEIKRNKIADVNVRFFSTTSGKLSRQFKDFFDLTPAETSELSNLIQTTKAEMWNAAKVQAQVSQTTTGEIVVRIPPLAAGPDIYDKVMDGFQTVLGDERFKDMMLYSDRQFDSLFNQFGGEARTITFKQGEDGRYNVVIFYTTPGGTTSQTMNLDELKMSHPEYLEFLPAK